MKKCYVTYFGCRSGNHFYMEFNDLRDAYIFAMCFNYVAGRKSWTYENIRISNNILNFDKFRTNTHRFTKDEVFDYAHMYCQRSSGWL